MYFMLIAGMGKIVMITAQLRITENNVRYKFIALHITDVICNSKFLN